MPRINIEDTLFSDDRYADLCIKLGDKHKALGICVYAFKLAQKYWIPDKRHIPEDAFLNSGLDVLLEVRLAKKTDSGYYVRGTNGNFKWWFKGIEQRRDAGKKRAKTGQRDSSGRWTKHQRGTSGIQPSSSSSSSTSNKNIYIVQIERLYKEHYPKKEGKTNGIKSLSKKIKTKDDILLLERAIKNYKSHVDGQDKKYIKHFSTFANCWEDYIELDKSNSVMDNIWTA